MIRTKRALAFILAAVMTFTSVVPSYAEGNGFSNSNDIVEETMFDVSESDNETVFDVSEDEIEEEFLIDDVSGTEESAEDDNGESAVYRHIPVLDISDYVWMLGGLDAVYEEQTDEDLLDNKFASGGKCEDLQGAYEAVTSAIANKENVVDLSNFYIRSDGTKEGEEHLLSVVAAVVNDNSKFGYFSGISSYSTDEDDIVEEIIFDYDNSFDADVYETALKKAYNEAITDDKESDLVKAMELHNWLVQHVVYDLDFSNPNRYSGYGAIVDRECVCMGYSIAYGDLLEIAGIKHGYITSTKMNHMWNVIRLDGKWYHVDVTWDDPSNYALGRGRFYTFLVSTPLIKQREHNYNDWQCRVGASYNYYDGLTSVSCTSTTYDSYWWQDVTSMTVYYNGYFYYQKDYSYFENTGYILKVKADDSTGTATTVVETKYSGWYANVSTSNDYLVYKDGNTVSRLKFGETTPKTVYPADPDNFTSNIYETLACGGTLYVMQGSNRDSAKKKSVTLFRISDADLSASTKTLTYGTNQSTVLSATYRKNNTGIVAHKWYILKPGEAEYVEINSATEKTYTFSTSYKEENSDEVKYLPAGTYKIRFEAELDGDVTSKTITITINKASFSVKNKDYAVSTPYDAAPIEAPTYDNFTTNAPSLTFDWYKSSTITKDNKLESAPVNAGIYYLVAGYEGDTNIKKGSASFKVSIEKRMLAVVIGDQTILWDDSIVSDTDSIHKVTGLQGTDNITSVVLKASTKEPTDEGTISCTSIVIRNDSDEKVNSNYDIHYTYGCLEVKKRDIVITPKNQEIFVGDTIFDEVNGIKSITGDITSVRYVVTSIKFITDRTEVGVGTIRPDGVKIMRTGTNTDVTRYFNVGYLEGTLTIRKKSVSSVEPVEFWHESNGGVFEDQVNVLKVSKLPQDAKNVSIEVISVPTSTSLESVSEPIEGLVSICGKSATTSENLTFEYIVSSDNYEDISVKVVCHVGQNPVNVVFYAEGGSFADGSDELEMTLCEGEPLPEDIVSRMWYNLNGWYSNAGVKQITASNTEVWAHWTEKYKVSAISADVETGSEVEKGTKVSISTQTSGAMIYFTTDGTVPDVTDNNLYKEAITINENTTIKAVAVKKRIAEDGRYELYWQSSDLFEATYYVATEGWGDLTSEEIALFDSVEEVPEGLWYTGVQNIIYNGKAQIQSGLKVFNHTTLLVKDKDYVATYSDNKNAGTASLKIKGKGNYNETAKITFEIFPVDIETETAIIAMIEPVKAGNTYQKPNPTVKYGSILLKKSSDYTVFYQEEGSDEELSKVKKAGTYKVCIKGKGNYAGTKEIELIVTAETLMSKTTVSGISGSYNYIGSEIIPKFKVTYGTKTLVGEEVGTFEEISPVTDYVYEFKNNIENGTATLILSGTNNNTDKGSFFGTKTITFKIRAYRKMSDTNCNFELKSYSCTGEPVIPKFTVKYKNTTLTEGSDYTFTISDNVRPGKIKVKCTGKGIYSGTKIFTVSLSAKSISKATVNGIVSPVAYNGNSIVQNETLIVGENVLTKDVDYTVTYKANNKVGTASIVYTGINGYCGTFKKTFTISKYNLLTGKDVANLVNVTYDHVVEYQKGGTKPSVVVSFNGKTLKSGTDYTIKYDKNKAVDATAKPVFTITGKGNFTGTLIRNFAISKADVANASLQVGDFIYSATKTNFKSPVTLTDSNGVKLVAGTDYDKNIVYTYAYDTYVKINGEIVARQSGDMVGTRDNIPAGSRINVTVTGNGNYTGTINSGYFIVTKTLAKAKIGVSTQKYTGSAVTLSKNQISVKVNGKKLADTDYDIIGYADNVKVGNASVIIRGKGNYSGTRTVKFKITAREIIFGR